MRSKTHAPSRRKVWAIAGGIAITLAIVACAWAWNSKERPQSGCAQDLINPAACSGELAGKVSLEAFRGDLEKHLAETKEAGNLSAAGIYFRDLRFGPTFAINADESFLPMSLMKLPVLVSVLKAVEGDPAALEERFSTPNEFAMNVQLMNPAETLVPGNQYALSDLLRFMIAYSDNRSLGMVSDWLAQRVGDDGVADVMVNLGLIRRGEAVSELSVSAKGYAAILRILYNAAYLSPEQSQYALGLLAESDFNDGIASGLPDDVRTAHKFGVRENPGTEVLLHDCGIVYHPGGPYILCVMTRGTDYDVQARYVREVARRVYDEMSSRAAE